MELHFATFSLSKRYLRKETMDTYWQKIEATWLVRTDDPQSGRYDQLDENEPLHLQGQYHSIHIYLFFYLAVLKLNKAHGASFFAIHA